MQTRVAREEDLEQIRAFDRFFGSRAQEVAEGRMMVAEVDGKVIGYVSHSSDGLNGRPFVHFLRVEEGHRRKGIATELLRRVGEVYAGERLFLSTEEWNREMQALLSKSGWTYAGRIEGANRDGAAELYYYRDG